MKNIHTVKVTWDSEANLWIAASDDITHFELKHTSLDTLLEYADSAVRKSLGSLDFDDVDGGQVFVEYIVFRRERLP